MSAPAIGIDLGTSTSEIAVFQQGESVPIRDPGTKSPIVPSLIAVSNRGELLVGEDARLWVDTPGHGVREIKRKMGSGEIVELAGKRYRPEELSALILRKLKSNAEVALGQEVSQVVLSVPANFNDAARQATLNAAKLAGLEVVQLINEPTAAALAFGVKHIDLEAQVVVFDFGGGTLDVTVLEMMEGVLDVRSSFGDPQLGGKDFDEALARLILRKFAEKHGQVDIDDRSLATLKGAAEQAKIRLSSHEKAEVYIPNFAKSPGGILDLDLEVTRPEFEEAVAGLLQRAYNCLTKAMQAGKVNPDDVDTVLLVGGTTYIPCVRRLVQQLFGGKKILANVDPDLAVVIGAATFAGMKAGLVKAEEGVVLSDVCPMGIGIAAITDVGGAYMLTYTSLIRPNTKIPFSYRYPFRLLHSEQDTVELKVYQTHIPDDIYPLEMGLREGIIEDIGLSGTITDIPPSPTDEPHPVPVDFSYDENGIVRIHAEVYGTGKSLDIKFEHSEFRMTDEEIREARERVRGLLAASNIASDNEKGAKPAEGHAYQSVSEPQIPKRFAVLIENAHRLAAANPLLRKEIQTAVDALKFALLTGEDLAVEQAADALADLLIRAQD